MNSKVNIWLTNDYPRINYAMARNGFVQIGDLPVQGGVIDFRDVQHKLQLAGINENIFLQCAALLTVNLQSKAGLL